MKYIIGCLGSAILGAWIATTLQTARPVATADAQDRGMARSGPSFPETPHPRPAPHAERIDGSGTAVPLAPDGLSPEEAINIAVYESANRGVVHITTRGSRGDRFFLMEVPTE